MAVIQETDDDVLREMDRWMKVKQLKTLQIPRCHSGSQHCSSFSHLVGTKSKVSSLVREDLKTMKEVSDMQNQEDWKSGTLGLMLATVCRWTQVLAA